MPLEYFTANFNSEPTPVRGWIVSTVARLLRTRRFHLMKELPATWAERRDGENWPYYAETMMGLTRLNHLQQCVETVIRESIPGDLIETGVWRGGGCILMRGVLAAHGVSDRKVFVADSFKGFPPPEATPDAGNDAFPPYLAVSEEQVQENFRRYSLLDEQVVFLRGWFKDTLPTAPIRHLAILRLDGDMYGSTMDALTALYPKLSPGGFCISSMTMAHSMSAGRPCGTIETRTESPLQSRLSIGPAPSGGSSRPSGPGGEDCGSTPPARSGRSGCVRPALRRTRGCRRCGSQSTGSQPPPA